MYHARATPKRDNITTVSTPTVLVDDAPAARTAELLCAFLQAAIVERGRATIAVSGGSTAPPMLEVLTRAELPWDSIDIFQVDERVAPDGDPARNANALATVPGRHHLMPVTDPDLEAAARRYAAELPARFDVVHLGVGPDGHTASWPPGDPVIDDTRPVALSGTYQGHVRMTLTPPVVEAAGVRVVLVMGVDKAPPIAEWLGGHADPSSLPVARVTFAGTTLVLDPDAASQLPNATASPP